MAKRPISGTSKPTERCETCGKFLTRAGRHRKKRGSGTSGPWRLNRKSLLKLAEDLVLLEDQRHRLETLLGLPPSVERASHPPPNTIAMLQRADLGELKRLKKMADACCTLGERGIEVAKVRKGRLAKLLSEEMKEPIIRRMLYREPYRSLIDYNVMPTSKTLRYNDQERRIERYAHDLPKGDLIDRILPLEREVRELEARQTAKVAASVAAWQPLKKAIAA